MNLKKLSNYKKWEDVTDELKEYYLMLYGEVYIYKNKIVPYDILNNYLKAWFRDEVLYL